MGATRNTVTEFMDRTIHNLKAVDEIVGRDSSAFHEVTQLINSVIGMLIFPVEEALNSLPKDALRLPIGGPQPRILYGDPNMFSNTRDALRKLRNSFAHFNIEFQNFEGKIVGLYAWSYRGERAEILDWVAYISIADLRALLDQGCDAFKRHARELPMSKLGALENKLGRSLRVENPAAY